MNKENQIFCDINSGLCNLPHHNHHYTNIIKQEEISKISINFFTDPICSTCWGIEPQLRKLKLAYGNHFKLTYRMGGLLQSWDTYAGKDVKKPEDVAPHWDKASQHYEMPIDGDIWIEDPLASSYIPCIAFKAAQMQGDQKSLQFLRRIKEMVFMEKKNISRMDHLKEAARVCGLDPEQLAHAVEGPAKLLFEEDLKFAKLFGVKGFPTLVFTDSNNDHYSLSGHKTYEVLEEALLKWNPNARKTAIDSGPENLFSLYPTLTSKEFAVLSNQSKTDAVYILNELYELGKLNRYSSKNGDLWSLN